MQSSRHVFQRVILATVLCLSLGTTASCGGDDDDEAAKSPKGTGKIVFAISGGSFDNAYNAAFLEGFQDETGIEVERIPGGDDPIAQVRAQVESGNVIWDVVSCSRSYATTFPDVFEPIDKNVVVATDDLITPEIVGPNYVSQDVESFPLLAYSTEAFPKEGPETWADFFDTKKFPGPRGLPNVLDAAWAVPLVALVADGVASDDLIPMDLDRAYRKLDELKPDVRAYWATYSQSQDILRSGEVVMNIMTDGRALQLAAADEPVAVSWKEAFRNLGGTCVVKGSPNAKSGMKLLNYILAHPEKQAVFTTLTSYGPPTNDGVSAAKELGVEDFSSLHADELFPDTEERQTYVDENIDALQERYNAWIGQ